MSKIQHHPQPKRPAHPAETPSRKAAPPQPKSEPPAPEVKDHFLREVAIAVYQNHPLVMLCTQPQIRAVASKVPVVKDVAEAFCPIIPGAAKVLSR